MRDKQNGRQTELETNSQIEISYFVTIRIPNTFSYRSVATYISYTMRTQLIAWSITAKALTALL